jgi:hypothetical protein
MTPHMAHPPRINFVNENLGRQAAMNLAQDAVTVGLGVLLTAAAVVGVGVLIGISAWGPR